MKLEDVTEVWRTVNPTTWAPEFTYKLDGKFHTMDVEGMSRTLYNKWAARTEVKENT